MILGLLLFWAAGIGFGVEIERLLTPANYPVGSDPSFDICAAIFFFLLCLLGAFFIGRGLLREERLAGKLLQFLNIATLFDGIGLVVVLIIGGMIFSANATAAAQYKPVLLSEPAPDYSLPAFPTPGLLQPTPTFDSRANYLAGPIKSAMSGLRVGTMWISSSRADSSIYSIQVYMDRAACIVQAGGIATTYAVEKSERFISGPIQVQDGSFFASQDSTQSGISIRGVLESADQAHGTLYLRYIDPTSRRSCDLGNFTWNASSTDQK